MTNTFFTSDLHFGHEFVSKLRGFEAAEAHDEFLFNNWSNTVRDRDVVWVLGDLAMSRPDDALDLIGRLPGVKHLVAGNHDPVSPIHRRSHNHIGQYLEVFESVQAYARKRINGHDVLMSHYPYLGDGSDHTEEARYQQFRLPDLGAWLLHGHTHMADQRLHGHQIHVGVDAWNLRPVALGTIEGLIREAESVAA